MPAVVVLETFMGETVPQSEKSVNLKKVLDGIRWDGKSCGLFQPIFDQRKDFCHFLRLSRVRGYAKDDLSAVVCAILHDFCEGCDFRLALRVQGFAFVGAIFSLLSGLFDQRGVLFDQPRVLLEESVNQKPGDDSETYHDRNKPGQQQGRFGHRRRVFRDLETFDLRDHGEILMTLRLAGVVTILVME